MKLRVLTLSKPYVASAYRDKLRLLAEDPRFHIGLVCPPDWAGQAYEAASEQADEPFFCRQLPIRWNGKNHFHSYLGLEALIREFRPDVLNVEEEHYSLVTLQAYRLALKYRAKPLFYTWQNIMKSYPPPFSWIEQYVFRHSLLAVVGNSEAGDILRAKAYRGPIETLPQMGVNERLFPVRYRSSAEKAALKQQLGLDAGRLWILYCGRLVPEKGIVNLLDAAAQLGERQQKVGLLIMGQGPDAAALQAQAAKMPASVQVKFVPFVPSHQVPQWMSAADILCLPSLTRPNWKEQFGRVLVEAMASSTVVVGSSSGEIPKVIADAGAVFAEGDSEGLRDCLMRLIEEPQSLENYKLRALRRVQENYTNRVIAQKLGDAIWEHYHAAPAASG